jgi:hypothetical protein
MDELTDSGYLIYMVIEKDRQHQPRGIVKASGDKFFYNRDDALKHWAALPKSYQQSFTVVPVWAKMLTQVEAARIEGRLWE